MNLRTLAALVFSGALLLITPAAQVLTYRVPSTETPTIQSALDAAKPVHSAGQTVLITVAPGLYRESIRWQSVSNAALTIEATGENTVISGSNPALWTSMGSSGQYAVDWPYSWALSAIPANWPAIPLELRHKEMLWINDKPLVLSLSCETLQLNHFCVDTLNKRMIFRVASEPLSVEVAMRETPLIIRGDNITLRGLTVEHGASDLDKSAAVISGRNVTLEGLVFRQNVSGGLGTGEEKNPTVNLVTRNNLFADNGFTGWGGAYNTGLRSTDDTALRNNWRGYQHGWTGWHVAGVKHLRSNNVIYTNLSVRDNLTHGGWWDFDHRDVTLINFESRGNLNAGAYIEASPGAFTIRQAIIVSNARANAYAGLFATNSTNVTLDGVYIENTGRPALFIGGEQCRPVGSGCLPVASGWQIRNSTFISTHSAMQFAPPYGLDLWLKTLTADFNVYAGRVQPFLFPSPYNRRDLAGYQAMLRGVDNPQEQNSRDTIATATPTPTPTPSATTAPTITRTATRTPAPLVPTATGTPTPPDETVTPVSFIIEFNISGRAEIRIITP